MSSKGGRPKRCGSCAVCTDPDPTKRKKGRCSGNVAAAVAEPSPLPAECESTGKPAAQFEPGEALRDWRQPDGARRPVAQPKLAPKESPIVAWLTGAAVKQAIAKAARSLAEGKSEDVIAQVGSLVEENALLKSDNAVLRNEIASLAKRLDKVRAELDAIKRAVARGLNKEDFEFSSHRSIIDEIVGKGYGHTDSGERLLRMHAQEVVAWPMVHLRRSSGRLGLSSTIGSLVDESALLKSDKLITVLCLIGGPAARQEVERSACRARHGQEGCHKGGRTQVTSTSAAIGASFTR